MTSRSRRSFTAHERSSVQPHAGGAGLRLPRVPVSGARRAWCRMLIWQGARHDLFEARLYHRRLSFDWNGCFRCRHGLARHNCRNLLPTNCFSRMVHGGSDIANRQRHVAYSRKGFDPARVAIRFGRRRARFGSRRYIYRRTRAEVADCICRCWVCCWSRLEYSDRAVQER